MICGPVPYEKLLQFQERLGLTEDYLLKLDPYRELFIAKKEEFSAHFHTVFQGIPDAKLVLDYEERPGLMQKIWAAWFGRIFRSKLDRDLYAYLWRIGLRHVEVNLDQRYSNLGFSVIRQFCHKIVLSEVDHGSRTSLLQLIDDIMDLCLLVETSAYIEATTRCDIEIIKGIARPDAVMSVGEIRHEAVVTLLAVLEIAKLRLIAVAQAEGDEEIIISRTAEDLRGAVARTVAGAEEYR